jgi:hypothetical protein
MWTSIVVITLAIAVASCAGAALMQPKRMRAHWRDAFMRQAPPAPARQDPQSSAHEYAEGADRPRAVSSCVADHLGQHYRPVVDEPMPDHLTALIRRL